MPQLALVSRRGAVDWLCFERAGGHTAFARILDHDRGGALELEVSPLDHDEATGRLDATVRFWRGCASRCSYDGPYHDAVVRSALASKGLVDARTGAIIAAPTTSLPEEIGGVRNWDYRFTWIRDAAWHLNALFGLGYTEEAEAFMGWLSRTTAGTADDAIEVDEGRAEGLCDRIRAHIERYGVDPETGALVRIFGQPGVDAASLLFVLEGFLDADDERVDATLEAIRTELADEDGTLVRRYVGDDGSSGTQSAFWWCSFWSVSVHVERGDVDRARELFERLLEYRSDLGLLSEEIDADTHELLGNFPQAISHVGLIDAALRIAEAERSADVTERVMPS